MFFLILWLYASSAQACPACNEFVERGRDEAMKIFGFTKGINWSIFFMLAVPYLMAGGFIAILWRSARRARLRRGTPHE